jgi:(E)-2-((N-methylformamido)methylene)succinate hydrolase
MAARCSRLFGRARETRPAARRHAHTIPHDAKPSEDVVEATEIRIGEIDRPTLVVTGEKDVGSNPRMARLMHERIRGSQLTIIPEQKHSILTEVPDLVADVMVRFLLDEGER